MAARGRRRSSATGRVRPSHQTEIYDAEQCAAADLRAVLLAAEGGTRLLCPLSGERLARDLRSWRRAHQATLTQRCQPLRQGRLDIKARAAMTEIYFYHLERRSLEEVLPSLLERSLERGWRAVVQAASEERVEALDTLLWTYREESFLPHGTKRDGDPDMQPVYLTTSEEHPNGATV